MDGVISQATQLGVSEIFPVISERTQVRSTAKVDRWNKIALGNQQSSVGEQLRRWFQQPVDFQDSFRNQKAKRDENNTL